jgi:single-strand DNA-binding protein
MSDMNSISVTGRLTRDAEKKLLPTGTVLVVFDIANNVGFGQHAKVQYFTVNLWGKQGESILQYLVKGKSVGVVGVMQREEWQNDAGKGSKNVINAKEVTLLSSGVKTEAEETTF